MANDFDRERLEIIRDLANALADQAEEKHHMNIGNERIKEVLILLEKLDKLYYKNIYGIGETEEKRAYHSSQGWVQKLRKIKQEEIYYQEAFTIIIKILDLLKKEESVLNHVVFVRDDKGKIDSIKTFGLKESELNKKSALKLNKASKQIEYIKNELALESEKKKKDNLSFFNHLNAFEETAKEHLKNNNGKLVFNEGHTIEAFYRHMLWMQRGYAGEHKIEDFTDRYVFSRKHVAIMYWYSLNSAGWWTGGDIANVQYKGSNPKLATYRSIDEVSNLLLDLYNNGNNFKGAEREAYIKKITNLLSQDKEFLDIDKLTNKTFDEIFKNGEFIRK